MEMSGSVTRALGEKVARFARVEGLTQHADKPGLDVVKIKNKATSRATSVANSTVGCPSVGEIRAACTWSDVRMCTVLSTVCACGIDARVLWQARVYVDMWQLLLKMELRLYV